MADILDIQLDEDGDIKLTSIGDFGLVDSVIQQIRIKLLWFFNEWQWNEELGLHYYENLFVKNPDIRMIEEEIRETIFNVKEITEVPTVSIRLDKETRTAYVSFVAKTDRETYRREVEING